MIRVLIGSVVAAVAMLIIGFLFWATPLAGLGMDSADDGQAAAIQQALAANLRETGTYQIPSIGTQAQTNMYSRGPIATIHYNMGGFAAEDLSGMLGGLVLNLVTALLIGAALLGIDRRVPDLASRARVAVIIAVAAAAYCSLGTPIYWHHDWGHAIYVFVTDALALVAAGLIMAWFLPRASAAAEDATARAE